MAICADLANGLAAEEVVLFDLGTPSPSPRRQGTDDPQVQPVVSSGRAVAEIHLKANPVIVLRTTEENAGSWRFRKAFTRL